MYVLQRIVRTTVTNRNQFWNMRFSGSEGSYRTVCQLDTNVSKEYNVSVYSIENLLGYC